MERGRALTACDLHWQANSGTAAISRELVQLVQDEISIPEMLSASHAGTVPFVPDPSPAQGVYR